MYPLVDPNLDIYELGYFFSIINLFQINLKVFGILDAEKDILDTFNIENIEI